MSESLQLRLESRRRGVSAETMGELQQVDLWDQGRREQG